MNNLKRKPQRSAFNPGPRRRFMAIVVAVVVLICAIGIMSFMLVQNNRRIEQGRQQMVSGILDDLTMMQRTYEQFEQPRADIEGELLPRIKMHLYSAYTQNLTLVDINGQKASILGNDFYTRMNAAIDSIDKLFKSGGVLDNKNNALTPLIAEIQVMLTEHEQS